jgi:hypothetical protein
MTGIISRVRNALDNNPPTIGAAIRFMTSAPLPVAQSNGTKPINIVDTVINLGRTRRTVDAPPSLPWAASLTSTGKP